MAKSVSETQVTFKVLIHLSTYPRTVSGMEEEGMERIINVERSFFSSIEKFRCLYG